MKLSNSLIHSLHFDGAGDRWASIRAVSVAGVVALMFAVVTWRATTIALGGTHETSVASKTVQIAAKRADIVDRNDELLATSLTIDSLAAAPQEIWDAREVADGLATVFPDLNVERLVARLQDPDRKFVWIRRKVSPRQRQAVYDLGLEGLRFEKEVQRIYTGGSLAGHLIGYTNVDSKGISGLELAHQERLAAGAAPLKLTIDTGVQFALEDELNFAAEAFNIKGGSGIVLDVKTGAVRAVASWPTFDPNRAGDAVDDQRLNRAINGVFELGSVFKPLTVAAALDAGVLRPTEKFNVARNLQFGSITIKDRHPISSVATVTDILAHSSNVGTVKISQLLDLRQQKEFLDSLGLLSRPQIVFPGAAAPILPPEWNELSGATISYGHGLAVSPLALAAAFTAIANDGEMVRPRFIEPEPEDEIDLTRVISAPTARVIAEMMRTTVVEGTGTRADVYGYEIAGKTGTAEKPGPDGYDYDRNICSFVSFFPASRPEYVVLIVLDEPEAREGEGKTAAMNAAPLTGRLIARIAPMLGVDPVLEKRRSTSQKASGVRTVSDERAL
ncbi:peptidoglycan D,D-transpeptidase FtsI family protein [Hirschia maritima]|uniref:peptidoglycan D,D-transpeptidase FtsI family protein n=1 Tax=Hirschia maritima TaxID=1121961 RepID=UPI0003814BEB|nr:penicillin-binding protein 2 [Hirschia maritima]